MRTPSLRRRVTRSGIAVFLVLVVSLAAFVYLTLREQLEDTLEEVLAARVELARELDDVVGPEELAERLQARGVPVIVTTADGRVIEAEPALPRFQGGPPAAVADVPHPRISRTVELRDGGTAEVFATRAGVDATLREVLLLLVIGTAVAAVAALLLFRRSAAVAMAPLDEVVTKAHRTASGRRGERLEPDEPDTELGRMAVAYDGMLDELEAALAQARAAEERTRRFLDDAAHQLRTPLAAVRATVESLLSETRPEERDRLMANLVREAARGGRILTSLLTLARIDAGDPPRRDPVDLAALLHDEVERARSLAPQLTVELDVAPDVPRRLGLDEVAVRGAVANLLDNARRHAAEHVEVRLTAEAAGGVVLSVLDDGPGVPADRREAVFERFVSLDGHGGSGLGLPIARSVARSHGGDLRYDGGGFELRLSAGTRSVDGPAADRTATRPVSGTGPSADPAVRPAAPPGQG